MCDDRASSVTDTGECERDRGDSDTSTGCTHTYIHTRPPRDPLNRPPRGLGVRRRALRPSSIAGVLAQRAALCDRTDESSALIPASQQLQSTMRKANLIASICPSSSSTPLGFAGARYLDRRGLNQLTLHRLPGPPLAGTASSRDGSRRVWHSAPPLQKCNNAHVYAQARPQAVSS